jgi:hypothetical protein
MISEETRIHALALFLKLEKQCGDDDEYPDIHPSSYQEHLFEVHAHSYLVLTDEEADEKARKKALEDIWACNVDWMAAHFKKSISDGPCDSSWNSFLKCIKRLQQEMCEDSNGFFLTLLEDKEKFADDVISADGRGPLLSRYDGEENYQEIVPWIDIKELCAKLLEQNLGWVGEVFQKALREEDLDEISIFCDWASDNPSLDQHDVEELRAVTRKVTLFIYKQ